MDTATSLNSDTITEWQQANQAYLMQALLNVRTAVGQYAAQKGTLTDELATAMAETPMATPEPSPEGLVRPPALVGLGQAFDLSPFERDVLLLCAGMALDATFELLCEAAQPGATRPYPTFALALAALPEANWSAISPAAPLRYWHLIELGAGQTLTHVPLRINESILHYLVGMPFIDEDLQRFLTPIGEIGDLVPSHQALAAQIVAAWSETPSSRALPVVQLVGPETANKRVVAAAVCALMGANLQIITAQILPADPGELQQLLQLWTRESILNQSVLLLDCDQLESGDGQQDMVIDRFIDSAAGFILVSSRQRRTPSQRPIFNVDVAQPQTREQKVLWQNLLAPATVDLNGHVDRLVAQFNLSAPTIEAAFTGAAGELALAMPDDETEPTPDAWAEQLWAACRKQARPHLGDLAQHIEARATWEDLVLPEAQIAQLRDIAIQVRHRYQVYHSWGFAGKSGRGLGISVLFSGGSGTGKTMAAEVLAATLNLDLYRLDLSAMVSKYIGETEKNLRRVFDAAEMGGAVLLFDEADALFGKRSEVKDSHDRHANIEVSYLLQRMEAYRGLAILTTNLPDSLDKAFVRRLRFMVNFPFPNAAQRAAIWQRVFPPETPTATLDFNKLARLGVTGGNIRNIAMHAAFLAAEADESLQMNHLKQAAQHEYRKLEKPFSRAEVGDWA